MANVLGDLLGRAATANGAGGVLAFDGQLHGWTELDEAAERLAGCLVANGVSTGDRVAVLHPKSVWSLISVHAIVRCGAVMVPLDPLGPKESVRAVLEFCAPTVIISNTTTLQARASSFALDHDTLVILTDHALDSSQTASGRCMTMAAALLSGPTSWQTVDPDDLAYIIFTSGSTGEPKGIAHTHRSALAYVVNAAAAHQLQPEDRVAGTAPLHFDMSTLELYVVPFVGATTVLVTEAQLRFPASLSARLAETGVTVLYVVPYQLRQLCLRGDLANRDLTTLRQISFGGEQFAPGVLAEVAAALPPAELVNVYGPAEVNGITSHSWPPHPEVIESVSIGTPWPGVRTMIVDETLAPVEGDQAGELLVACPSQMVGYWGRAELDDVVFVERDGDRWYRTGDLVHLDESGHLHFVGRADTRVKVRGVRIELETVENALDDMPGISSCVVGVANDAQGSEQVVAWIVLDGRDDMSVSEVRRWCHHRLPDAAVPTEVRIVQQFAPSRTGKIDRKLLRATLNQPTES